MVEGQKDKSYTRRLKSPVPYSMKEPRFKGDMTETSKKS